MSIHIWKVCNLISSKIITELRPQWHITLDPSGWKQIKKPANTKCGWICDQNGHSHTHLVGLQIGTIFLKVWDYLNIHILYDPAIPLLSVFPKETGIYSSGDIQ